jgi:hypothetical protein
MRFRTFFLTSFALTTVFALPVVAHAAIPFFGPIIQKGVSVIGDSQTCPLGWGAVINVVNNIISFLITIAIVFVAPVMIAYAGFLYVWNPMNPSGIAKAKSMLTNIVVGIVVALAAWMIVDAVMAVLYNPTDIKSTWSNLIMSGGIDPCRLNQTGSQAGALSTDSLNQADLSNIGVGATASGGGKCAIQNSGLCSASGMSVFGAAANQASIICSAESANGTLLISKVDVTTSGIPVSFGLFQINITANDVSGLGCPKAFDSMYTGSHRNVQILAGKQGLYDSCKKAALTPAANIQAAYNLFRRSGYSWKQWSTHTPCGLTFLENNFAGRYACAILSTYE